MRGKAAKVREDYLPTPLSVYVDEIIAEERQKEQKPMATITFANVKIRAMHNDTQMSCEFDMVEATTKDVKDAIIHLRENGFVKIISNNAGNKPNNDGKKGTVKSVEKVEGQKYWKVTVTLSEAGAGEQTFNSFSGTSFRKGDKVRLTRNEKGFYDGVLINDEDDDGNTQSDIPF